MGEIGTSAAGPLVFELSDEHRMVRETIREFAEKEVAPGARPAEPTTVLKPLPHSLSSLTRKNSTLTCSVRRV